MGLPWGVKDDFRKIKLPILSSPGSAAILASAMALVAVLLNEGHVVISPGGSADVLEGGREE